MLILNKQNKSIVVVGKPPPNSPVYRSDMLIPQEPRNLKHYSIHEWYNIYQVYIDNIVSQFMLQLKDVIIEEYDLVFDHDLMRHDLLTWMYKTSSTKSKGYYFLK